METFERIMVPLETAANNFRYLVADLRDAKIYFERLGHTLQKIEFAEGTPGIVPESNSNADKSIKRGD